MQEPARVAIDLGAESCRVSLLRWRGEQPTIEVIHRIPNGPAHRGASLTWELERIATGLEDGLRKAAVALPRQPEPPKPRQTEMPQLERDYLQLLLREPSLLDNPAGLSPETFFSPAARRIYSALLALPPEERADAPARLSASLPEDAALVMQLAVSDLGADSGQSTQTAAGAARMLKRFALERRMKELKSGAMTPEQLQEYSRIMSELKASGRE